MLYELLLLLLLLLQLLLLMCLLYRLLTRFFFLSSPLSNRLFSSHLKLTFLSEFSSYYVYTSSTGAPNHSETCCGQRLILSHLIIWS